MGLQWTVIASFMYFEVFVTFLLIIPFITNNRWHQIFKSKFLKSLGNMSYFYFRVMIFVLGFLFIDAYREQRKYALEAENHTGMLDADMQAQMKMFRAQRNLYICGAALMLCVIIRRISSLISEVAITTAEKEAALKQAKSASSVASQLMGDGKKKTGKDEEKEDLASNELIEENKRLKAENEAALKQAKSVGKEYDRLMAEHEKLQKQLEKATGSEESKKDA